MSNQSVDSFPATVAQDVKLELENHGVTVDELDLYRSGFDGVLYQADEPVWWYSLPALLKGYIDRVWNYGLMNGGDSQHGIAAVRWIGLAGHPTETLRAKARSTVNGLLEVLKSES